jgi:hypothetical protein
MMDIKLSKKEQILVCDVRNALVEVNKGDPLRDFMDQDQIIDALKLLKKIVPIAAIAAAKGE